jgi:hypothetical protein
MLIPLVIRMLIIVGVEDDLRCNDVTLVELRRTGKRITELVERSEHHYGLTDTMALQSPTVAGRPMLFIVSQWSTCQ